MVIDGAALAAFAHKHADPPSTSRPVSAAPPAIDFGGLVTKVTTDIVMSQIELQGGPHRRVVSSMSTEAAPELGWQPGSLAVAIVRSTEVILDIPHNPPSSTAQNA